MTYEFEIPEKVLEDEPELAQYMDAVRLMLNRMLVSHYKYGAMSNKYPESAHAVDSVLKRLRMYVSDDYIRSVLDRDEVKNGDTGNTENCLDAANFCIIEHLFPSKEAHFRAQEAHESPGIVWKV